MITTRSTDGLQIPGLPELWAKTLGNPRIRIALLDGPVDQTHPSLAAANLTLLGTLISGSANQGPASQHGTHIASVIFGQHGSPVRGIAPGCRGLIVPVFSDGPHSSITPCSQIDLARAITQSVEHGANVINISGGELSPSDEPHPLLANAVRLCAENGVLIVAAVGNDGCECLQVPAAVPSALAVGAMDAQGLPLDFSNWGEAYQTQGILAPGENILGAAPGGDVTVKSGTSYATPIVSAIAALLLCIQQQSGHQPNPHAVRSAILRSALPCYPHEALDCRRYLVGGLNTAGAHALLIGENTVEIGGRALLEGAQREGSGEARPLQRKEERMTEYIENTDPEDGAVELPKLEAEPAELTTLDPENAAPQSVEYAVPGIPGHVHSANCGWG